MVLIRGTTWVVTFGSAGPIGGWTYALLAHLLHRDDAYWQWQDTDVWIFVWTLTAAGCATMGILVLRVAR